MQEECFQVFTSKPFSHGFFFSLTFLLSTLASYSNKIAVIDLEPVNRKTLHSFLQRRALLIMIFLVDRSLPTTIAW